MVQSERQGESVQREEALWNVNEVARFLNMSRSWVYKQVDAGAIPVARFGNRFRFHPARVREFATSLGGSSNVVPFRKR